MPNINQRTVELQKQVVEKFNQSRLPHIVMQGQIPHGLFIDVAIHERVDGYLLEGKIAT